MYTGFCRWENRQFLRPPLRTGAPVTGLKDELRGVALTISRRPAKDTENLWEIGGVSDSTSGKWGRPSPFRLKHHHRSMGNDVLKHPPCGSGWLNDLGFWWSKSTITRLGTAQIGLCDIHIYIYTHVYTQYTHTYQNLPYHGILSSICCSLLGVDNWGLEDRVPLPNPKNYWRLPLWLFNIAMVWLTEIVDLWWFGFITINYYCCKSRFS